MMSDQPEPVRATATATALRTETVFARVHDNPLSDRPLTHRFATPTIVLALCLLSLAFFWRVIGQHQVLIPIDLLYAYDSLWQSIAPHSFTGPTNPLDFDAMLEFYPWAALAGQALHHGVLALWNPYAFGGTPFLASMQPAPFYPINLLLERLVPAIEVTGLRAIGHLAVTLVGTFLFARSLKLSRLAALLASVAFGLGLPYMVWLQHPMSAAFAWLPWMLLCIKRTIDTGGGVQWLALSAAFTAVDILAGHGESTAHIVLLCGAYALFEATLSWHRTGRAESPIRALVLLTLGLILGIAMAAVQLLPTLAQLPLSLDVAARSTTGPAASPLGEPRSWITLVTAFAPNYFGNPTWNNVVLLPFNYFNYNETTLYIGIVPLSLAVLAVLRHRHAHTMFFAIASIVTLGIAMDLPILGLLNNLPLLRLAANGRLRIEFAFTAAILAGYGLDVLHDAASLTAVRRYVHWWLGGIAILVVPSVVFLHSYPAILDFVRTHPQILALLLHVYPRAYELHYTYHRHNALPLVTAVQAAMPALWMAGFALVLWLSAHGRVSVRGATWAIVALAVVDLFSLGTTYHSAVPRAQATAVPPAIRAVQHDTSLYRVAGLGDTLMPSLSSLYGLQDIRGYDPTYDIAYGRYFTSSFGTPLDMRLQLSAAPPTTSAARALNLLNVKYIFSACNVPLDKRIYQPIYRGAGCVYRNTAAMPRAFLASDVQWSTAQDATRLLNSGRVDPRTTALLDPATVTSNTWRAIRSIRPTRGQEAQVVDYALNRVDIVTRSASNAILILADSYAPGWTATVDGHDVPVARADAVLRAVAVTPGSHHVTFIYAPQAVSRGILLSGVALTVWLVIVLLTLGHRFVSRGQRHPRGVPAASKASLE